MSVICLLDSLYTIIQITTFHDPSFYFVPFLILPPSSPLATHTCPSTVKVYPTRPFRNGSVRDPLLVFVCHPNPRPPLCSLWTSLSDPPYTGSVLFAPESRLRTNYTNPPSVSDTHVGSHILQSSILHSSSPSVTTDPCRTIRVSRSLSRTSVGFRVVFWCKSRTGGFKMYQGTIVSVHLVSLK